MITKSIPFSGFMITNVSSTNGFHNLGDELKEGIAVCLVFSIIKFSITTKMGHSIVMPNIC